MTSVRAVTQCIGKQYSDLIAEPVVFQLWQKDLIMNMMVFQKWLESIFGDKWEVCRCELTHLNEQNMQIDFEFAFWCF